MQFFGDLFASNKLLAVAAGLVAFVVVVILGVVLYRLLFGRRLHMSGGRTRQPRLGVVDAFDLDRQRQLVLVRRDNVEHLVMIGGPNDVVIETSIVRAGSSASSVTGREKDASPASQGIVIPPISPQPSAVPVSAQAVALPVIGPGPQVAVPQAPPARPQEASVAQPVNSAPPKTTLNPVPPVATVPAIAPRPATSPLSRSVPPIAPRPQNAAQAGAQTTPQPRVVPEPGTPSAARPPMTPRPSQLPPLRGRPTGPSPVSARPDPALSPVPGALGGRTGGEGSPSNPQEDQRPAGAPLDAESADTRKLTPSITAGPSTGNAPPIVSPTDAGPSRAPEPAIQGNSLIPRLNAAKPVGPVTPPVNITPVMPPRPIDALESLEEEMAKLLGRPIPPPDRS